MGVEGLESYLKNEESPLLKDSTKAPFEEKIWNNGSNEEKVVIVDFSAFVHYIADSDVEKEIHCWLGGEYAAVARNVRKFVQKFKDVNARLVFVIGKAPNNLKDAKVETLKKRKEKRFSKHEGIVNFIDKTAESKKVLDISELEDFRDKEEWPKKFMFMQNKHGAILETLLEEESKTVELIFSNEEDDPGVAYEAMKRNCFILTNDTDMLCYKYDGPIQGIIFFNGIDKTFSQGIKFEFTSPEKVAKCLGIGEWSLPAFGTLLGNDYSSNHLSNIVYERAIEKLSQEACGKSNSERRRIKIRALTDWIKECDKFDNVDKKVDALLQKVFGNSEEEIEKAKYDINKYCPKKAYIVTVPNFSDKDDSADNSDEAAFYISPAASRIQAASRIIGEIYRDKYVGTKGVLWGHLEWLVKKWMYCIVHGRNSATGHFYEWCYECENIYEWCYECKNAQEKKKSLSLHEESIKPSPVTLIEILPTLDELKKKADNERESLILTFFEKLLESIGTKTIEHDEVKKSIEEARIEEAPNVKVPSTSSITIPLVALRWWICTAANRKERGPLARPLDEWEVKVIIMATIQRTLESYFKLDLEKPDFDDANHTELNGGFINAFNLLHEWSAILSCIHELSMFLMTKPPVSASLFDGSLLFNLYVQAKKKRRISLSIQDATGYVNFD
uniref:Asteroid domain-containing protein n=1 Tax=Aureoumbra lagunensis TaxID=44058 RepID=A0A7S3JXW8_9STRA|mmetsp:Transcript_12761/g.15443  ORF Transcript_12761/g.15443 Transcript_12761/m.15443 type:complete len:674 (+) Transcript_12761:58-2079(+)